MPPVRASHPDKASDREDYDDRPSAPRGLLCWARFFGVFTIQRGAQQPATPPARRLPPLHRTRPRRRCRQARR